MQQPRLANFFWYLAYEVPAHSDVLSIRLRGRVHKEVYFREMSLGLISGCFEPHKADNRGAPRLLKKRALGQDQVEPALDLALEEHAEGEAGRARSLLIEPTTSDECRCERNRTESIMRKSTKKIGQRQRRADAKGKAQRMGPELRKSRTQPNLKFRWSPGRFPRTSTQ